jgi:hypothetical protein
MGRERWIAAILQKTTPGNLRKTACFDECAKNFQKGVVSLKGLGLTVLVLTNNAMQTVAEFDS